MPPKNTLELECLIEALTAYVDAKKDHDQARNRHAENGGYSWGHYGQSEIERVERCAGDLGQRLNALIDARVTTRLKELGLAPDAGA